jgi:metal-sulfur cluster biosynthetic enzyme
MTADVRRDDVIRQLRRVAEPCAIAMGHPLDIWEMGLVEEIEIEEGRVRITLCLTDAGCIHLRGMRQFITDELMALEGVRSVEVRQTLEELWTPERMGRAP